MFSQDELKLDRKVELYDSVRKKFELFVDTTDVGNILLFGLAEFMKNFCLQYLNSNFAGQFWTKAARDIC